MKNNQILAALTGVFFLCSAMTCWRAWSYHTALRRLGNAQAKLAYQRGVEGPMMHALLTDTSDYSKKNPAVIPILQALTNDMNRPPANAQKPGMK
jgi:hypothetical protein